MGFIAFRILGLVASLASLAPSVGCVSMASYEKPGPMIAESKAVSLDGAQAIVASIELPLGELRVERCDGTDLLADFEYNVKKMKPKLSYSVHGSTGRLTVVTPEKDIGTIKGDVKNNWTLAVPESVPLDFDIDLGAGTGSLDLAGLTVRDLDIEQGVGELTVDLSGPWEESAEVTLTGGVADAMVYVPENVGVIVVCNMGLGSVDVEGLVKDGSEFTNKHYGRSPITVEITINSGVGSVKVRPSSMRDSVQV